MIPQDVLEAQDAFELPMREMLNWPININVNVFIPVVIQNNVSVQVCVVNSTCTSTQASFSGIWYGQ